MNQCYFLATLLAFLVSSTVVMAEEQTFNVRVEPQDQGFVLSASSTDDSVKRIQGKTANGDAETTIVDVNGNLKIIPSPNSKSAQPAQAEMDPKPIIPTIPQTEATTPNASSETMPGTQPQAVPNTQPPAIPGRGEPEAMPSTQLPAMTGPKPQGVPGAEPPAMTNAQPPVMPNAEPPAISDIQTPPPAMAPNNKPLQ